MGFLRRHWYDLGGLLAIVTLAALGVCHARLTAYGLLMWLSLVSLFLHQLEEYRIVGTFPGMINRVLFHSAQPDRFPLNTNTALVINVGIGWLAYGLAAVAGEQCIWLGMATMLVSLGNVLAHTLVFNIKGKTLYNAGMATSLVFFIPCIILFFTIIHIEDLVSVTDYVVGIPLGVAFNFFGIVKLITWLADTHTTYIFEDRQLLPRDRGRGGECMQEDARPPR